MTENTLDPIAALNDAAAPAPAETTADAPDADVYSESEEEGDETDAKPKAKAKGGKKPKKGSGPKKDKTKKQAYVMHRLKSAVCKALRANHDTVEGLPGGAAQVAYMDRHDELVELLRVWERRSDRHLDTDDGARSCFAQHPVFSAE